MRVCTMVFCTMIVACLILSAGCYTVFQSKNLDDKPAVTESSTEGESFSGDFAYRNLSNDRWNYYLTHPWWNGSIWQKHSVQQEITSDSEDDHDSEALPAPPVFAPPLPVGAAISPTPVPARTVPSQTGETRMKGDESADDSTQSQTTPAKKPGRRGGEGDPK